MGIHFTTHPFPGQGYIDFADKCFLVSQVALLGKGNTIQINASPSEDIHVLLIAGVPLNEPIARHGPFVMNTWEEIEQAFSDNRSGKLGSI